MEKGTGDPLLRTRLGNCAVQGKKEGRLRVVMHDDDLCIRSSTHWKVFLDGPARSKQSLSAKHR